MCTRRRDGLSLAAVIVCGILAVVGDNIGYAIGHFGGRPPVLRYGRYVFLTEPRLRHVESFFARRGSIVVPTARFIDGLRQFNGVVAALAVQCGAVGDGVGAPRGDVAGNRISTVHQGVDRYQKYLLIGLGVALAAWLGWWLVRRRQRSEPEAATLRVR